LICGPGYTADVSCQFQDLGDDTTPSLDIEPTPLEDEDGNVLDINSIIMGSDCAGPVSPDGPREVVLSFSMLKLTLNALLS
jgi:hypothetical protein